jgi:hypothetical protein
MLIFGPDTEYLHTKEVHILVSNAVNWEVAAGDCSDDDVGCTR